MESRKAPDEPSDLASFRARRAARKEEHRRQEARENFTAEASVSSGWVVAWPSRLRPKPSKSSRHSSPQLTYTCLARGLSVVGCVCRGRSARRPAHQNCGSRTDPASFAKESILRCATGSAITGLCIAPGCIPLKANIDEHLVRVGHEEIQTTARESCGGLRLAGRG